MTLFGHEPNVTDVDVVVRLNDPNEARLVCGLLESYGIPASIRSGSLPSTVYPTTVGVVLVVVPLGMKEEALRIVEAHRAEEGVVADTDAAEWGEPAEPEAGPGTTGSGGTE